VEPSPRAAELATARGIEVHCGTLDDAPFGEASFDLVIFNHSLEHIPRPADALHTAAQLLRPDGRLVVAVPNFGCWQRRFFGTSWFHLDIPRHLQHFERDTLMGMVLGSGLRTVNLRTYSSLNGLPGSLQYRLFGRWILPQAGAARVIAAGVFRLGRVVELIGDGDQLMAVGLAGDYMPPISPKR
jgi:SAM-dependent methyltransferase